jgi:N-acetylneuraminic acid mutarotase
VDVFNFKTNTWTTLPESLNLPTQRAGNTAVPFGYKLLIMGGESSAQIEAHAEVEGFDTKLMKWEKFPNLNKGRHGTGATVYKKKVYVAAGSGNRGGGPELTSMEVLKEK